MSMSFIHDVPSSRVVFANGSISQVSAEVERLGCSRVMLISGGPEAQYASIVEQQLGDRLVARFTDVVMHVPVEIVATALVMVQETGADCLVALGGGSSTGVAKAVALDAGERGLAPAAGGAQGQAGRAGGRARAAGHYARGSSCLPG